MKIVKLIKREIMQVASQVIMAAQNSARGACTGKNARLPRQPGFEGKACMTLPGKEIGTPISALFVP